jgi:polysaccharide export outer membrane protein
LFYVSGQVKSPGGYPMKPNLTMRMAVSRAGGVTDAGSLSSITVTRAGKKLTHVDLDSKVMSGDVLVIGERLF